jgi:hypothetical protein
MKWRISNRQPGIGSVAAVSLWLSLAAALGLKKWRERMA